MALMAGRHVLCETPFTQTYKETQELYQLAERKGLVLVLAWKTAFCPSFVQILDNIRQGVIGEVVEMTAATTTLLNDGVTTTYNNERIQKMRFMDYWHPLRF